MWRSVDLHDDADRERLFDSGGLANVRGRRMRRGTDFAWVLRSRHAAIRRPLGYAASVLRAWHLWLQLHWQRLEQCDGTPLSSHHPELPLAICNPPMNPKLVSHGPNAHTLWA